MKCRVEDLTGALLDAAVAKAGGIDYVIAPDSGVDVCFNCDQWCRFEPSSEGRDGDDIIDREHIATIFLEGQWRAWMPEAGSFDGYDPGHWLFEQCASQAHGSGPTRLVAAMRAFVRQRLGEEIDL